ncbi:G-type lectin S-receptor-like serine/threonine-protein kinase [Tanacetum coccineum]
MRITDVEAGLNPNVTATLEDNGNFGLINETNKRVLWESFNHPTDVLLPGMKLGYDLITGRNWTLTSSLSEQNPEPAGAFTLSWEPTKQRLVIQRRNQPYWTSGKIKDQQFPYLFELNSPNREAKYKLTYVYNNIVGYFSYIVDQDLGSEDDDGPTPMWRLKANGQIEDLNNSVSWTPEFCYGLDSIMGCMKDSTLLQCRGEKNSFSHQYGSFDPRVTSSTTDNYSSLSISDCFVKCWNECDCVGLNSSNTDGTGCTILKRSNNFSQDLRKNSLWAYVISSQNPNNTSQRKKGKNKMQLIWILIDADIPLVLTCLWLFWCRIKLKHKREEKERRKRDEYFLELTASKSFKHVHQLENNGGKGIDLLVFSVASIMAVTNDFSVENKLGQDEMKKAMLDWPKRFSIIVGIAQGLLYLHKYSRMRVIHRDLKASNILLDENMNPKKSDFGMARIFKDNEVKAMTNRVWLYASRVRNGRNILCKVRIFSFVVLILEIITGRKNSSFARLDGRFNLLGYAWELWQRGDVFELKDSALGSNCDMHQFLRTVHVALLCVQDSATDRPTTSDMISMLLNDTISLPTPNNPPYAMVRGESTSDKPNSKPQDFSVNSMSITIIDGR